MPRPQSKSYARRSRQKFINNLYHSKSYLFSNDKENKETSPKSSFSASSASSVDTLKLNSSILKPISVNTPLPLKRRQYSSTPQTSQERSMSVSSFTPCALSAKQKINEPFLGSSSRKIQNYEQELHCIHNDDEYDFYQLVHNSSLLELMKNTICQSCLENWDGKMHLKKREGLYFSIEFQCQCSNIIRINSSTQSSNTKHRDINIRSVIAANLSGVGHAGLMKICGALNVPPPVDEDHFSSLMCEILSTVQKHQHESMKKAVEEACEIASSRKLTVSGDGSWQKRGFASLNGVAAILSSCSTPKNNGDDDEQHNMQEYSLDESENSDYSDEYDDPPTMVTVPIPSTKAPQENVLDHTDDVQSRHELKPYKSIISAMKYRYWSVLVMVSTGTGQYRYWSSQVLSSTGTDQ
ncbi:unnamed protein product [Rotaria sp. Silwood1]|nr:unnamed protein product [Rotaria sp. Silwood1]